MDCGVLWWRRLWTREVSHMRSSFANGIFNRAAVGRVENVRRDVMERNRCARPVQRMAMSVWDMPT
jgi:hypothetical protein